MRTATSSASPAPPAPAPAPGADRSPSRRPDFVLLVLAYGLVCMIWGTTWIAIKFAVTDIPPLTASGSRFVIAAPIFVLACNTWKVPIVPPRELLWLGVFLCFGYFAIPFYLYNYGEQTVSSGLTAICFASVSIMMVLMSRPILGTRVPWQQMTGILTAFVALGLLIANTQQISGGGRLGVIAILVAAGMHAFSYMMIKKHAPDTHTLTLNTLPMAAAGVGLVTAGLLIERPEIDDLTGRSILATLYLGVIASVIGFGVYFWLVQQLNTVTVSFVFVIFPVIAQFVGVAMEGTSLSFLDVALTSAIVLAFAWTQWFQRQQVAVEARNNGRSAS